MKQIRKFYLTEFMKTQRYFIPVMTLFLLANKLSYTEIFILYAVKQAVVFLLEIPSGVVADQFGKRAALIFSRFSLFPAYAIFALPDSFWIFEKVDTFWLFLVAMVFMGVNKAFKSGTHKAYIFDYVEQNKIGVSFTEVIGKGKYWARLGEALACAAGGAIAGTYGFSMVFVFALGPAVINCVNTLTYAKIEEKHKVSKFSLRSHFAHIFESSRQICASRVLCRIIINAAILAFCLEASEIFFQPYMRDLNIRIELIGLIYTVVFIATAFGSRYAYLLEKRFTRATIANIIGWLAVIPLLILGFRFISIGGVFLFAGIIFMRNVRRPPVITELNRHIESSNRATILSIDALFRAVLALAFLPFIGYVSDIASMHSALLILGGVLVVNQILFPIPQPATEEGETPKA